MAYWIRSLTPKPADPGSAFRSVDAEDAEEKQDRERRKAIRERWLDAFSGTESMANYTQVRISGPETYRLADMHGVMQDLEMV